jgi:hypothetical protein
VRESWQNLFAELLDALNTKRFQHLTKLVFDLRVGGTDFSAEASISQFHARFN